MDNYTEPTNDELIAIAKKYAYKIFQKATADLYGNRSESTSRHAQNNATKIVGYLMKAAEQEDYAPSIGSILEEMKRGQ